MIAGNKRTDITETAVPKARGRCHLYWKKQMQVPVVDLTVSDCNIEIIAVLALWQRACVKQYMGVPVFHWIATIKIIVLYQVLRGMYFYQNSCIGGAGINHTIFAVAILPPLSKQRLAKWNCRWQFCRLCRSDCILKHNAATTTGGFVPRL